jgi:urease subunit alpha
LNEHGYIEELIQIIQRYTGGVIWLSAGGTLGGPAPDAILSCSNSSILPVSNAASLPYSTGKIIDLNNRLFIGLGLDPRLPTNKAFAEALSNPSTLQAEQALNDIGAIPMISSSTWGMEEGSTIISSCWRAADSMRRQRGWLPQDMGQSDNFRAMRYIAKYTANPAVALGIYDQVGSISEGKRADLVLWDPAFFGVHPSMVLVGGTTVAADVNATRIQSQTWSNVQSKELVTGKKSGIAFVSQASIDSGVFSEATEIRKRLIPIEKPQILSKDNMFLNNYNPEIMIDTDTCKVLIDGKEPVFKENGYGSLSALYKMY